MLIPQSPDEFCARLSKLELILAQRDRRFWNRKLWRVRGLRIYKRWRHFYWRCFYLCFRFRFTLRALRQNAKSSGS